MATSRANYAMQTNEIQSNSEEKKMKEGRQKTYFNQSRKKMKFKKVSKRISLKIYGQIEMDRKHFKDM